jgi:hypothetical protein
VRDASFYVSQLLVFPSVGKEERRQLWRQAMASLAKATTEEGPGPLDGLHPDQLVPVAKAALADGLVDDVDWLGPAAAGMALYVFASALPTGQEQRELRRRVVPRLLTGNADTFTQIAALMAQTTGKGLGSPGVRARVGLVTELPLSYGIRDGALALSLVSRRELCREWIVEPSTKSLPARRLAARLLERAAREAARRASQGDLHAIRVLEGAVLAPVMRRLLFDRESLVWRHVAVARGLIAPWSEKTKDEITAWLSLELTPTEWRRAATSVAALTAVAPDHALQLLANVSRAGLFAKDPGISQGFAWGIPRAAESDPEAAGEFLDILFPSATFDIAEALIDARAELGPSPITDKMGALFQKRFGGNTAPVGAEADHDGVAAMRNELILDLTVDARPEQPVRHAITRALAAFAQEGAPQAHAIVKSAVDAAVSQLEKLEAFTAEDEEFEGDLGKHARRASLAALRDLDASLLERSVVGQLAWLGTKEAEVKATEERLDQIRDRGCEWIASREMSKDADGERAKKNVTLHMRRLRALLHIVDGDIDVEDDQVRGDKLRARWVKTASELIAHFGRNPPPALRRMLLATLARALDALIRVDACDVADAFLVLALSMEDPTAFETLAEASMDLDLSHVLSAYARFLRTCAPLLRGDRARLQGPAADAVLTSLSRLSGELSPEASARSEALRAVLLRLHQALSAMSAATGLRALSSNGASEPDVVIAAEAWMNALTQMSKGARTRLEPGYLPSPPISIRPVSIAVSRVLAGVEADLTEPALDAAARSVAVDMPRVFAWLFLGVVGSLAGRPLESTAPEQKEAPSMAAPGLGEQLPAWLPARRIIGGFYVMRSLGVGGSGTVFVVSRADDRHDPSAERFALKVPDYTATAARSLSEAEFMQLFRDEASALMSLPAHRNLARFVTFDMSAKPKPILVMELIPGLSLERMIESRAFDMRKCIEVLDDVLAGLEVMHRGGVGHLDLKPSNVVLRQDHSGVLVDFGLAGRNVRPGCATGPYGAPEVWGAETSGGPGTPMAADAYAFGCLAFEALTGRTLFAAPNEVAQVAMHLAHDGMPPPVKRMAADAKLGQLGEMLFNTLRRDGRARMSVTETRRTLASVKQKLGDMPWPIQVG